MDFFQIQMQTSLNIDLFIKNYLARPLKIYGSSSLYRHFKKNSKLHIKFQSAIHFRQKLYWKKGHFGFTFVPNYNSIDGVIPDIQTFEFFQVLTRAHTHPDFFSKPFFWTVFLSVLTWKSWIFVLYNQCFLCTVLPHYFRKSYYLRKCVLQNQIQKSYSKFHETSLFEYRSIENWKILFVCQIFKKNLQ